MLSSLTPQFFAMKQARENNNGSFKQENDHSGYEYDAGAALSDDQNTYNQTLKDPKNQTAAFSSAKKQGHKKG